MGGKCSPRRINVTVGGRGGVLAGWVGGVVKVSVVQVGRVVGGRWVFVCVGSVG